MTAPHRSRETPPRYRQGIRSFRLQFAALILVYTVGVFLGLYAQARREAYDSLREQAESYSDLVYHTRQWNARMGGVWVAKSAGVETNPYLIDLGIDADVESEVGTLTLRNPSAMMVAISELTEEGTGVSFHLTSTDPLNPANRPDTWESSALNALADGGAPFMETIDDSVVPPVYRYMRPLVVDKACMTCHARQGYEVGDMRGGLTVNIPTETAQDTLETTRLTLAMLAALTLALSLGTSQLFVSRLGQRLRTVNEQLEAMAVTDYLTGIPNRRSTFEWLTHEFARAKRGTHPLSVIEVDIDHFKRINDDFGHAVGDEVLRVASRRMREAVRDYDIFGRIGGEEFLVIAPDTSAEDALHLAERLVRRLRIEPVIIGDVALIVTASAGCATLAEDDERTDDLIARADVALYEAKREGRDTARSADLV